MRHYESNEPIRILHVIGIMNRGGAETLIMNLYRNINRDLVQFDFVENSSEPAAFDSEIKELGGRIYRCPHYNGKNYFTYVKWWRQFFHEHAGDYCAVHGHLGSTAAIYLSIAKQNGLYTIAHSHGCNPKRSLKQFIYSILSFPTRYVADCFFTCSMEAGRDRFGTSITRQTDRFFLLKNAIDTSKWKYSPELRGKKREQEGFAHDNYVIGHVGRFDDAKNQSFLVDCFHAVVSCNPSSRLLLVGDGPLRESIEIKVQKLGLREKVIFTGVRSDVSELMQVMDVLVFPSKNEGLPVTLVEAQATGLLCVISECIPEDAIITKDLVTKLSLNESPQRWAEHIGLLKEKERLDHSEEVKAAGFDIHGTAKWLEEFYLDKAKQ